MARFLHGHDDAKKTQLGDVHGDRSYLFTGRGGHTMRREGRMATPKFIVNANALYARKKSGFGEMNMTHYSIYLDDRSGESCLEV